MTSECVSFLTLWFSIELRTQKDTGELHSMIFKDLHEGWEMDISGLRKGDWKNWKREFE